MVTVPGKLSDDLAPGTLNSILKQAQLKAGKKNQDAEEVKPEEINSEEEN